MALAEHQQHHTVEAVRWFARDRAACGPPGPYAEEFDLAQRRLRGNLPQAFVHGGWWRRLSASTDRCGREQFRTCGQAGSGGLRLAEQAGSQLGQGLAEQA
ncbi:hypothetical protein P3T29_000252 [Kitasatospora sp. MAP5-34]|nr:hypothetical protein [Kitasatospora sp. MAP5-34]